MVFRGRPSKACHRCRIRRLKCDLRPGSCSACSRANETCHGYRDEPLLRIHDETDSVRRKALGTQSPRSLQYAIELQARDVFFAHYVLPGSRGWDFLIQMPASMPSYLTVSLDAVCLAFLAHRSASSSLLHRARSEYSTALRAMSRALPLSDSDAKHHMLTSSMCLDLFEKLTNTAPAGSEFWLGHINGSLALVRALGLEHLKDPLSLRLLVRLVTNCTISCVASGTMVPVALLEVRAHLERYSGIGSNPKWRLSGLMVEYARFRALSRSQSLLAESTAVARELDLKLIKLEKDMPDRWLPRTLECALDPAPFPRKEIYASRHITQAWNTMRLVRIMLHEFFLTNHVNIPNAAVINDVFLRPSVDVIQTMADNICASVLQYADKSTGSQFQADSPLSAISAVTQESWKHMDCSQTLNFYTLLFPLYVVGRSKWTSDYQKIWVINQLNHIGVDFDIPRALDLVGLIQNSLGADPWHVYAMLGSYAFAA